MFRKFCLALSLVFCVSSFANENKQAIQERSLIIKDGHFYPSTLHLFEGESLHLMIGNFMGHSTCVANEGKKFFVNVSPGNIVEQQVLFERQGSYDFTCPGLKSMMTVMVRHKPVLAERAVQNIARDPASIPDGIWVPKDNRNEGAW